MNELLKEKSVKLLPILQIALIDALKSVYQAIKNWSSEYGRTLSKEKNKRGIIKQYSISFHHKGTLKYERENCYSGWSPNKLKYSTLKSNVR